jgi:hypothetical protein
VVWIHYISCSVNNARGLHALASSTSSEPVRCPCRAHGNSIVVPWRSMGAVIVVGNPAVRWPPTKSTLMWQFGSNSTRRTLRSKIGSSRALPMYLLAARQVSVNRLSHAHAHKRPLVDARTALQCPTTPTRPRMGCLGSGSPRLVPSLGCKQREYPHQPN